MGWQKDPRYTAGGRWECKERRRKYNRWRHQQRVDWMRAKYQSDPVYVAWRYMQNRRSKLKRQRLNVLDQLARLSEEATGLGTSTRPTKST